MPSPDRTTHFTGDLQSLTRLIGAAILFFGVLLLAIIAYLGWAANQTATERERTLVANALNQSIARALNEQKSIAWWDDPVTKITDEAIDLEFTDANFGVFLTETYAHDEVYVLNAKDKPLYAFFDHKREKPSAFEARRKVLDPLIDEIRRRDRSGLKARPDMFSASKDRYKVLTGVQVARWAGHIVSVNGRPAVIAGMTIVPNIDSSLLKGTPNLLVSITFIDEEFISEIGRSLLLHDLALTTTPSSGGALVSEPFMGDDGSQAGYLTWTTRRPGQILLTVILPLVAFGVFATAVLARAMFRRLRQTSNELAERESQARHEAKHDALSGLPNRAHMAEEIEKFLLKRNFGPSKHRAVAAYIDIDRFKDINDTLGHEAGDKLIKAVGERLSGELRPRDLIARFGGDEFVILWVPAEPDSVNALASRIAAVFTAPFLVNGQNIRVTASIGLAVAPDHGSTVDELMRHADIALYEAKSQGRNRAVLFSPEMAEAVEHRRAIELDLRTAIDNDELTLHYQPIISCDDGEIRGVEALVRWRHPRHGELPPAGFIPIAENAGLLPALGEWVLDRAMLDSKRWPDLEVAINLSPVQFRHVDLETSLRRLTIEHGVEPSRFVLEITEGVLLEASDHTHAILNAIRAMGFQTALDDFGTGYSSLAYLCNFSFDKIKIDRSFISRLSTVDTSRTIIKSVVSLGRGLGMDIVAEGIETEFEAVMMMHLGCTELQGYFFSRPIDADAMDELLRSYEPKTLSATLQSSRALAHDAA
jgi:diguanylate cyclase (GGDEF)-like protein